MPVKKYVMGLLNPVTSAKEKYLSSQRGSTEMVWTVTGGGAFSNADHLRTLSEERRDGNKDQDVTQESRLKGAVRYLKGTDKRLILRAKITGAWMSVRGATVSGTVISATVFWVFYVLVITSLP